MTSRRWFFYCFLIPLLSLPAYPQAVISARSGLIHFTEGSVFLDNRRIEQTFGRFDQMKDGSELRTQEGRAEVILTPGTFLRLGENSAIRMLSSYLQDTRIELLTGSVAVDSQSAAVNGPVTILYSGYQVQISEPARCRIDSAPAQFKVEEGKAEVFHSGASVIINAGYVLPFSRDLAAQKSVDQPPDALDMWNGARANSIAQNNNEAGKSTDLSAAIDNWQNDPDALLGALGASGYVPSLGFAPPNYAPLSSSRVQGPYYPLTGPGLYSPSLGIWGMGALSPFYGYPRPVLGYYPYPVSPSVGTGAFAFPRHGAIGTGPYNRPPIGVRPIAPAHSSTGAAGHLGGRR